MEEKTKFPARYIEFSFVRNGQLALVVAEIGGFKAIRKGPCGPDGFAIHLRKTGLSELWRNKEAMSSINFGDRLAVALTRELKVFLWNTNVSAEAKLDERSQQLGSSA